SASEALVSSSSSRMTFPLAGFVTLSTVFPHFLQEFAQNRLSVEKRLVARILELGVPLHGDREASAGVACGLDDAVLLGHRLDLEMLREILHGLVVDGVHLRDRLSRVELRELRSGLDLEVVKDLMV